MTTSEIDAFSPAFVLLRALRERTISSAELLAMFRARQALHNASLHAIVIDNSAEADIMAARADATFGKGDAAARFCGLPITIKDCIDTRGLPTTSGVPSRLAVPAKEDAPIARAMRDSGVVLMGKTNTSTDCGDWQAENALFGRTDNPWNLQRTPGGSTGGGAAALAAGLTALELGSDIGGSIRVPAAFCGLYGHRPSDSLAPRYGYVPGWREHNPAYVLNALGPLSRSAFDLELVIDVVAGPVAGEGVAWTIAIPPARHETLAEFRVAMLPWQPWLPVDSEIAAALEDCLTRVRVAGAWVATAAPLDFDLQKQEHLYTSLLAIMECKELPNERRLHLADAAAASGTPIGAAQAAGWRATAGDFLQMLDQRERIRAAYREFFTRYDILLCPVALTPAFEHIPESVPLHTRMLSFDGHSVPYERMTVYPGVATLPGHPATAFPWGRTKDNLPIGLQAIGPYLEDRTPIRFAQLLEREFGGFSPPPGY